MAAIINPRTGKHLVLHAFHTFGRGIDSDTIIKDKTVSSLHASIRWVNRRWVLFDHSRNGTRVNTRDLISGQHEPLKQGDTIYFAYSDEAIWKVVNADPPITQMVSVEDQTYAIKLSDVHGLPSDDLPVLTVTKSPDGQWICEQNGEAEILSNKDIVAIQGFEWEFHYPDIVDETSVSSEIKPVLPPELKATFQVSRDEEHVILTISIGYKTLELSERAHHYLLLLLARQRMQDAFNNKKPADQGWMSIDALPKMMGIDHSHLNILIFRARKQVSKALSEHFQGVDLIERKLGSIRLICNEVEILKGSEKEYMKFDSAD